VFEVGVRRLAEVPALALAGAEEEGEREQGAYEEPPPS
jgi:hypothetical protein